MDRIFISNLGKYNEGELVGGWFELGQDESELERFLKETVQIDAEYEEYFIADTDFEDIDMEVSEYADVFELNTAYQEYENLYSFEKELVRAILELRYVSSLREALDVREEYTLYEEVTNDYDLGYYFIHTMGAYNTEAMGNLANYIDYKALGRDIYLESDGGYSSYGYLARY